MLGVGDKALGFTFSSQLTKSKLDVTKFSKELTTGVTSNALNHLKGDLSLALATEHQMKTSVARLDTLRIAAVEAETKQTVLSVFTDAIPELVGDMHVAMTSALPIGIEQTANQAELILGDFISKTNTNISGKFLFSGDATKTEPFADWEDFAPNLRTLVSGLATTQDVLNAVDDWFETDPLGFESNVYGGSVNSSKNVRLDDDHSISIPGRADDPAFRDVIRGLALVVLSQDDAVNLSDSVSEGVFEAASGVLLTANQNMIALQGNIGEAENQIERALAFTSAEVSQSDILLSDLLRIDGETSAVGLQDAQTQLERLYAVMARNAQLSLLDYI